MKKYAILSFVIVIISLCSISSSALTISSTYADLTSTSSQVTNLINYANNYDTFIDSKYVCFRSAQNDYYIVWGSLELNGNRVQSVGSVEYIRYYRPNNTGDWIYDYGTDSSFSLTSSYINTSNIDSYGFSSSVFSAYYNEHVLRYLLLFILALVFAGFITRRSNHI